MERTTIMLPHDLKLQAAQYAKKKGISLGELIRNAIAASLNQSREGGYDEDPLFSDQELFSGTVPTDLSVHHDDYLYGNKTDDLS